MEDDFWWEKTFDGRRPSMEEDTNIVGGRVIMGEVSLQKSFPYSNKMKAT